MKRDPHFVIATPGRLKDLIGRTEDVVSKEDIKKEIEKYEYWYITYCEESFIDIDKNDDIWIGTRIGLRIISNPSSFISEENPQTEPVIIEENGLGEELFRDSSILQIEVDAGNQKWISIDDGGVFYS